MTKEKKTGFTAASDKINKDYGKGLLTTLDSVEACEVISTGILSFDLATMCGGWPRGRIIEMYGSQSSGKSTLACMAVAEAQKLGLKVLYIDMEQSMDRDYAAQLGVDPKTLLFSQPNYGEQALNILWEMVNTGDIGLAVVDSVAALVPQAYLEGNMEDSHMAVQARLMGKAMNILTPVIRKTNTAILFINQLRANIGGYGLSEVTPGGNALKFYASLRVDIRAPSKIKDKNDLIIGSVVKAKIVKSKVGIAHNSAEFELIFGKGVSTIGDIFDLGVKHGIIDQQGAWYQYKDQKWQGRDNAKIFLRDNEYMLAEIRESVIIKANQVEDCGVAVVQE